MAAEVKFRLLGAVEIRNGGQWRSIMPAKSRQILALLLCAPGRMVLVDHIISAIRGGAAPQTPAGLLPFSAGSAMTDVSSAGSSTLLAPAVSRVHPLAGAAVFVTSIAILASIAVARFRRQDV